MSHTPRMQLNLGTAFGGKKKKKKEKEKGTQIF